LTAGVAVVVAAAVVSDLPTPLSRASDIQAETTVISEINTDVAPCVFAIRESLTLYGDETAGGLTAGNRAQIPALLRDDQDACSFVNESVFDLSDIDVPGSTAGKDMGQAVNTTTVWATSDALEAIEQIQTLTSDPGDHTARARLATAERQLSKDAATVRAEVNAGSKVLHTTLPPISLSTKPSTTGSSDG
jgi:hypothetical protein